MVRTDITIDGNFLADCLVFVVAMTLIVGGGFLINRNIDAGSDKVVAKIDACAEIAEGGESRIDDVPDFIDCLENT